MNDFDNNNFDILKKKFPNKKKLERKVEKNETLLNSICNDN